MLHGKETSEMFFNARNGRNISPSDLFDFNKIQKTTVLNSAYFFFFFYELRKNKINISKPLIEKKKLLTKTNTRGEASRISLYAYICVYTVLALKMTRLRKRGVYATRTKSYVILRPINIDLNLASKLNMLNIYV